jgi:hypothetical protein
MIDLITWPVSLAIVGSVLGICYTVIRIYLTTKKRNEGPTSQERLAKLEVKEEELRRDIERHEEAICKLGDQFIKLLSDDSDN